MCGIISLQNVSFTLYVLCAILLSNHSASFLFGILLPTNHLVKDLNTILLKVLITSSLIKSFMSCQSDLKMKNCSKHFSKTIFRAVDPCRLHYVSNDVRRMQGLPRLSRDECLANCVFRPSLIKAERANLTPNLSIYAPCSSSDRFRGGLEGSEEPELKI